MPSVNIRQPAEHSWRGSFASPALGSCSMRCSNMTGGLSTNTPACSDARASCPSARTLGIALDGRVSGSSAKIQRLQQLHVRSKRIGANANGGKEKNSRKAHIDPAAQA
jgi:hypothetical protein